MVGSRWAVRWTDKYALSDGPPHPPWAMALMPDIFPVGEPVDGRPAFAAKLVLKSRALLIEPAAYLKTLLDEFRARGGVLVQRDVHEVAELRALQEPVVVNCTGLGARALFGDEGLQPAKGQLVMLPPQPEVDYMLHAEGGLYMASRADGVVLGGSWQLDDDTMEPDPEETRRIVDGHRAIFSRMP